jgi:hypothetical protein
MERAIIRLKEFTKAIADDKFNSCKGSIEPLQEFCLTLVLCPIIRYLIGKNFGVRLGLFKK